MKLQSGHLPGIFTALVMLCEQPITAKTKYWVKRFKDKLQPEVATFEDMRRELIQQYGEKDDEGKLIEENNRVNIADMEGFMAEFKPIFETEINFPFRKIKMNIAELEKEDVNLDATEQFTADQLLTFLDMVIEVEGLDMLEEVAEDQAAEAGSPEDKVIRMPEP